MHDPNALAQHFRLADDSLFKIASDGTLLKIKKVVSNRLATTFKGQTIYGPELAWALAYGSWPMYPIVSLSQDPWELVPENLVPIRNRRVRFRAIETPQGWRHALSQGHYYATREKCQDSWIAAARRLYAPDVEWVRQQEQLRDANLAPSTYQRTRRASNGKGAESAKNRPPRPAPLPGKLWYWYEGQWLALNPAVHVSDDWKLRAAAHLAGKETATYDALLGQTVYS